MSKEIAVIKTSYESKLLEHDDKLRQLKIKYDDVVVKYRQISQENVELLKKIELKPSDFKNEL